MVVSFTVGLSFTRKTLPLPGGYCSCFLPPPSEVHILPREHATATAPPAVREMPPTKNIPRRSEAGAREQQRAAAALAAVPRGLPSQTPRGEGAPTPVSARPAPPPPPPTTPAHAPRDILLLLPTISPDDDDRGVMRPFPVAAARTPARQPAHRHFLLAGGVAAAGAHGPRLARGGGARVRGGGGDDRAHAVGQARKEGPTEDHRY